MKRNAKIHRPKIEAWFDGCCEPVNPGGTASYGAVIFVNGKRVWECSELFRPVPGREKETSNNVAEYSGFLAILDWLLANGQQGADTIIHGDSKLVIEQMQGNWKMHGGFYVPIAKAAQAKLRMFKKQPKLKWIPREENDVADELSKAELIKAGVEFRIQPESTVV
jgi:ribonuclease HI